MEQELQLAIILGKECPSGCGTCGDGGHHPLHGSSLNFAQQNWAWAKKNCPGEFSLSKPLDA